VSLYIELLLYRRSNK